MQLRSLGLALFFFKNPDACIGRDLSKHLQVMLGFKFPCQFSSERKQFSGIIPLFQIIMLGCLHCYMFALSLCCDCWDVSMFALMIMSEQERKAERTNWGTWGQFVSLSQNANQKQTIAAVKMGSFRFVTVSLGPLSPCLIQCKILVTPLLRISFGGVLSRNVRLWPCLLSYRKALRTIRLPLLHLISVQ